MGRKAVHPQTQLAILSCAGFNQKTSFDRRTPCDQDFLRKFARDTEAERLHEWFNAQPPRALRSLKVSDKEGLFIGGGFYLFVPDNDEYEHSVKLLFDEHNHPVDPKKADSEGQAPSMAPMLQGRHAAARQQQPGLLPGGGRPGRCR